MEYKINYNKWGSMFSVPTAIVDKNLKLCSGDFLKVILFILKNPATEYTTEDISKELNINENEVKNAIDFWIERNILYKDKVKEEIEKFDKTKTKREPRAMSPHSKPDSFFVAKRLREDSNLAALLEEAQVALSKTLSPGDVATLVMLHDTDGLPCEVIAILINYCVSIGQGNMRSIERYGTQWGAEGIYNLPLAEEKIKELSNVSNAWNKVAKLFGIRNAGKPTKAQMQKADTWLNKWHFSNEMIVEAYERCVDKKGSYDMSYINGILNKWYEKDIKSLSSLKSFEEKKKSKGGKNKNVDSVFNPNDASFDINEFEGKSFFDD